MNLRAIDFQLLIAFDALLTDLSVTRASRTMGVSQSAMSHMLARLRVQFVDPLLIRTSRGMEPTSRALELVEPVRVAIRQVRNLFDTRSAFDSRTTRTSLTLRMGDMNAFLLEPIFAALDVEAPLFSLSVKHVPPADTVRALDADELDFAISTGLAITKSIQHMKLLEDRLVCILRKDHPALRRPFTRQAFLKLRHANILRSLTAAAPVDQELSRRVDHDLALHGLSRDIALNTTHGLAIADVIRATSLVAVIPERMARVLSRQGALGVKDLPWKSAPFEWRLYWHRRYEQQPVHKWFRKLVHEAAVGMDSRK